MDSVSFYPDTISEPHLNFEPVETPLPSYESCSYKVTTWPKELDPALEPQWSKLGRLIWNVVSVILFPIGLCRLAHFYLREFAFSLVAPGSYATYMDEERKLFCKMVNFAIPSDDHAKELTLETPDGAKLNGLFVARHNSDKAVLYVGGNCEGWEGISWGKHDSKEIKEASWLMINPRGFGKSTGPRSPEGYALDIYSAYKFLIEEHGIDPENIVLVGRSFGGAIGTLGASLIQKEYPDKKMNVVNWVSFASLSREISLFSGRVVKYFTGLPEFFGSIPMWIVAKLFNLEMDVKAAWDTLKGKKLVIWHPNDEIIPEAASLADPLRSSPPKTGTQLVQNGSPWHNAPLCGIAKKIFMQTLIEHFKLEENYPDFYPAN